MATCRCWEQKRFASVQPKWWQLLLLQQLLLAAAVPQVLQAQAPQLLLLLRLLATAAVWGEARLQRPQAWLLAAQSPAVLTAVQQKVHRRQLTSLP